MKRRWKNRPALELALAPPPRLSPKKFLHTSKNLDLKLGSGCLDIKAVGIIRIAMSILYLTKCICIEEKQHGKLSTAYRADIP